MAYLETGKLEPLCDDSLRHSSRAGLSLQKSGRQQSENVIAMTQAFEVEDSRSGISMFQKVG